MSTTGVPVVTGAGSGLGRHISRALLTAGWQVAAAGRRADPLRETVAGYPDTALAARHCRGGCCVRAAATSRGRRSESMPG